MMCKRATVAHDKNKNCWHWIGLEREMNETKTKI